MSIALPPEGFGASIGPAQNHGRINAFAVRLLERSGPEVVPDPDDGHPDEVEMLEPSRLHLELPAEVFVGVNAGVDRVGGGMGRGSLGWKNVDWLSSRKRRGTERRRGLLADMLVARVIGSKTTTTSRSKKPEFFSRMLVESALQT